MSARDDDMITPQDDSGSDVLAPTWTPDGHLDEGTIHAWLDGAFDQSTSSTVESHVRACSSCQASVAEARGLIAGASRTVRALDAVPSAVVPMADVARTASRIVAAAAAADATRVAMPTARPRRAWYTQPMMRAAAALAITVGGGAYVLSVRGDDKVTAVVADSSRMLDVLAPAPTAPATLRPEAPPAATRSAPVEADRRAAVSANAGPANAGPANAGPANAGPANALRANSEAVAPARSPAQRQAISERSAKAPRPPQALADAARAKSATVDTVAAARERRVDAADVTTASSRVLNTPPPAAAGVALPVVPAAPPLQGKVAGMRIESAGGRGGAGRVGSLEQSTRGIVAGLVVDARNAPLEGAAVSLVGTTMGTTTNARGEFALPTSGDTATLLVRRLGYESSRLALSTKGDDTTRARVMLNASTQQLSSVVTTQMASAPPRFAREERAMTCFEVKALEQATGFILPRALLAGELSSIAPVPGTWIGWPVAGATAFVTFVRGAGGSLTGSAETRGVRLVLALLPREQGWEGTATQTREGVASAQRVRIVSGDIAVCKP